MELNVDVKCLNDNHAGQVKLTVGNFEGKTVKDLKQDLQNLLGAPICDQVLSYRGRRLNVDSVLLKTLYMREGDWITVEFPAKVNIEDIDDYLEGLKEFANKVKADSTRILAVLTDAKGCFVSYHRVLFSLDNLAFDYFIPWKSAKSVAHRHYFVQQGGFEAFMEAMKFSHQNYKADQSFTARENYLRQVKHLNCEQRNLQMHCLSLLWNFSENCHDRQLVLKNGGLQWVTAALLLDPQEYTDEAEVYQIMRINESAVGCLVQYVEFPSCQEVIARNKEAVDKLICMVQSLMSQRDHDIFYPTYTIYCSQIAANTLFCCACCLSTPRIFANNKVHLKLLKLAQCVMEDERYDLALGYYCCLFLARIRSSPLVTLDSAIAGGIDDIIARFMTHHPSLEVSRWEEEHNYVWVSMLPFVSLAFAGGRYEQDSDFECATEDTSLDTSGAQGQREQGQMAANAALGMDSRSVDVVPVEDSCQHDHVESQVSHKETVELSPQPDVKVGESHSIPDLTPLPGQNSDHMIPCKSLAGTCEDSVRNEDSCSTDGSLTWPGSLQMQRFGVYTLQHMLHSKENSQVLQSEGLLPYVVCLSWNLYEAEQDILKEELRNFRQNEAPSLKVISKSALARMNGLETVYKM